MCAKNLVLLMLATLLALSLAIFGCNGATDNNAEEFTPDPRVATPTPAPVVDCAKYKVRAEEKLASLREEFRTEEYPSVKGLVVPNFPDVEISRAVSYSEIPAECNLPQNISIKLTPEMIAGKGLSSLNSYYEPYDPDGSDYINHVDILSGLGFEAGSPRLIPFAKDLVETPSVVKALTPVIVGIIPEAPNAVRPALMRFVKAMYKATYTDCGRIAQIVNKETAAREADERGEDTDFDWEKDSIYGLKLKREAWVCRRLDNVKTLKGQKAAQELLTLYRAGLKSAADKLGMQL